MQLQHIRDERRIGFGRLLGLEPMSDFKGPRFPQCLMGSLGFSGRF